MKAEPHTASAFVRVTRNAAALVLILSWSAFALGLALQFQVYYQPLSDTPWVILSSSLTWLLGLFGIVALALLAWRTRSSWRPVIDDALRRHTEQIDQLPLRRIGLLILLVAAAGLFAELMVIRVHSAFFQVFAYYKNFSLLSCFLGLGIGYALGGDRKLATPFVLPGLALQIALLHALRHIGVGDYLQDPILERGSLGLDPISQFSHGLTVYGFLLAIFSLNALCFIPLGHLCSRLMMRTDKLVAYGWNLGGSMLGIALFSLVSFAWTPPSLWILLLAAMLVPLLRQQPIVVLAGAGAIVAVAMLLGVSLDRKSMDLYSPYQVLTLNLEESAVRSIAVNNVYFQRMLDLRPESAARSRQLSTWANYYSTPYLAKPEPEHVLIVGAGSGNDVAAAIRNGAGQIDAVEIDPMIQQIGRSLHPEAPYSAENVTSIVDDARSFMRYGQKRYDLIVYGLLDSHTLLSGVSSIRLDTYVYTVEAFRDARARLKPGGVICLTFTLMNEELGRKLYLMLSEAFDGRTPRVLWANYDRGVTFLIGEDEVPGAASEAVPAVADFPTPSGMRDVTERFADPGIVAEMSTDDWPFFYMPRRVYPTSYVIVIGLLLGASLVIIAQFLPGLRGGFSLPCFFLGAGFMLLETKSITELALVFGSTWVVASTVIGSILLMAFFANLLIARIPHPPRSIVYGLLLVAIVLCWQATGIDLAGFPPALGRALLTLFLTAPLFFAGLAFSTELKVSASIPAALSANLIGSMLGGFLEYNSMYFGFESLWLLAFVMYGAAFASRALRT